MSEAPTVRHRRPLAALIVMVCALLFWMATERTPIEKVWADEGTYLAMTESLARDFDLRFDERDLERIEERHGGRTHVILQRTPRGIAYSKPLVYPIAAAPFYAVAGERGLVLLNVVAFAGALFLALLHLQALARRDGTDPARSEWTLATWALASSVVPYLFWRMPDLLGSALTLAGLSLALAPGRGLGRGILGAKAAPWIGTAILALSIPMRLSNGALALVPALEALLRKRPGLAILRGATTAAVAGAVALVSLAMIGSPDPYRAARTTFLPESGYPAGPEAEVALERFSYAPAAHVKGVSEDRRKVGYAGLYYLVGRHSGLLFYFPAALLFTVAACRRFDATSLACAGAALVSVAFFVAWKPENFFGGETFIGNRYFLPIYPLALFILPRLPRPRLLMAVWVLAGLAYASAATSIARAPASEAAFGRPPAQALAFDRGNQSHAHAGIFRLLPYESTAQSLAGRRDRYWARHFVRFVDPYARVEAKHFDLVAGMPATEVLIAHWQPPRPLRLEVRTDAAEAVLEVTDWRGRRRYQVGRNLGEVVGVEVPTAPPWRVHGFWFESTVYQARTLRLRLKAPAGSRAQVLYLGDPVEHERAFAYTRLEAEIPRTVEPDSPGALRFRVRNDAPVMWEKDDVVAITVRLRLDAVGGRARGDAPVLELAYPLPQRLGPGEETDLELPVRWPRRPGRYEVTVDLVQEHVAWFEDRVGEPLAMAPIDVGTPTAETGP
ncbi:MAG: hypothetical protein AAGM22_13615 [Acidobacteriota bacterium]